MKLTKNDRRLLSKWLPLRINQDPRPLDIYEDALTTGERQVACNLVEKQYLSEHYGSWSGDRYYKLAPAGWSWVKSVWDV